MSRRLGIWLWHSSQIWCASCRIQPTFHRMARRHHWNAFPSKSRKPTLGWCKPHYLRGQSIGSGTWFKNLPNLVSCLINPWIPDQSWSIQKITGSARFYCDLPNYDLNSEMSVFKFLRLQIIDVCRVNHWNQLTISQTPQEPVKHNSLWSWHELVQSRQVQTMTGRARRRWNTKYWNKNGTI